MVNELSIIFQKLGIESEEVFKAAESKWNFMPFRPGLVGGHCIGIDPYYLTFKAETIGYTPKVILAGREMNDGMGELVAQNLIKAMQNAKTIPRRQDPDYGGYIQGKLPRYQKCKNQRYNLGIEGI